MLARAHHCATVGLDGQFVEVDIGPGQPGMFIVGLSKTAIEAS